MDFKETIRRIKNEYNIVDYIKANGVDLESSGSGTWKGLCPFHNEKTPSFSVSEDFQNYRCFGCDASGDILSFAEKTHTISFLEAVKMLAEEKGIAIDDKLSAEASHDIMGIRKVLSDSQQFFQYHFTKLPDTHAAKQEILKRGLKTSNNLYGYAPETANPLYTYLKEKGHSDKNIKDSNLVVFFEDNRKPWDFFHGRLLITLSDYLGRPISFTSRKIYKDDKMQAKYINGKESPIFHKKSNLFGADLAKRKARETETIYVVEGQFDQIAMYENGIENVVATSGTAFTDEHANLLLRMVGDSGKIVFIMDGDIAGIDAAIKVFEDSTTLHSNARAVLLKRDKDPCDYIEAGGIELLKKAIDTQVPLHDFVVNITLKRMGGTLDSNNRQKFAYEVARFAKHSQDSYIIDNMLSKASVLSAISIENIKDIYNKINLAKPYQRPEVKKEEKTLNPLIQLNFNNDADVCMFSALSLLVRMPDELIPYTPKRIHKKFRPFLKEMSAIYKKGKDENADWRFISEDYSDSDFATALQEKVFESDPKRDVESTISQYKFLFETANELYQKEHNDIQRAKAFSSIANSSDPKEIARVLRIYKESQQ